MHALERSSKRRSVNIWPGFVDALATLLLVVIFVLMVFMIAQFFLSVALTGKDEALSRLNNELAELADLLALERDANAELRINVAQLSSELQSSLAERDSLSGQLAVLSESHESLLAQARETEAARESLAVQLSALMAERSDLENRLQSSLEARESLAAQLASLTDERDRLADDLRAVEGAKEDLASQLAALSDDKALAEARLSEVEAALAAASQTVEADKEKIELQLAEIAALKKVRDQLTRDLNESVQARKELEEEFGAFAADRETIEATLAEVAALKRLRDDLTRRLAAAEDSAKAAGSELEEAYKTIQADKEKIEMQLFELSVLKEIRAELDQQLKQMEAALAAAEQASEEEKAGRAAAEARVAEQLELTEEAQLKVDLLNRQIASLRRQLAKINVILEATEVKNKAQNVQIADLGKRLNLALATKVQELARYRSEFFGRLREVLGDRQDIRIVGDRFVFQSELLFESGSAELEPAGRQQIAQLAVTLKELAAQIPPEINWILRVDGHTDNRPISTWLFASNWELSNARALSVVKFLIEQGIDPTRLAATGFGEFQPLEDGESDAALRRNRRIELKFTQK